MIYMKVIQLWVNMSVKGINAYIWPGNDLSSDADESISDIAKAHNLIQSNFSLGFFTTNKQQKWKQK